MSVPKDWYGEWFDSPYYHVLYKHRNHEEARLFLDSLCQHLALPPESSILDLACGKGRHSIYLHEKGMRVTGIDLSPSNIRFAKHFENRSLQFFIHDMRLPFREKEFDCVFNIFTSFGYFDSEEENLKAIDTAARALKKGGHFVLDFLNPYLVVGKLRTEEVKEIDGISFHIQKWVDEKGYIVKRIAFTHQEEERVFFERVKAIGKAEFFRYFGLLGLEVEEVLGNYHLDPFEAGQSERMIFITTKK
jgi:SAM-dependent methyltransferase